MIPPNAAIDLSYLLAETAEGIEPEGIPFPQANDLDKVADLVSMSEADIITKESIADLFEFDERQGDYYANAARYIGLFRETRKSIWLDCHRPKLSFARIGRRTYALTCDTATHEANLSPRLYLVSRAKNGSTEHPK